MVAILAFIICGILTTIGAVTIPNFFEISLCKTGMIGQGVIISFFIGIGATLQGVTR